MPHAWVNLLAFSSYTICHLANLYLYSGHMGHGPGFLELPSSTLLSDTGAGLGQLLHRWIAIPHGTISFRLMQCGGFFQQSLYVYVISVDWHILLLLQEGGRKRFIKAWCSTT